MSGSITVASKAALDPESEADLARYRNRIFVERLGWSMGGRLCKQGYERDQFDVPSTVYIIRRNSANQINGCARMMPTSGPYLLKELFPGLLAEGGLPNTGDVWELSRLAASQEGNSARYHAGDLQSIREILRAVTTFCTSRGVRRLVGVTYVAMVRLFRRLGIHAWSEGIVRTADGRPIVACWIEIDAQTREALGGDGVLGCGGRGGPA
jgi:acyl homoserine lactone synthase